MKKLLLYISISLFIPLSMIANDCNHIMDDYQMEKIIESMNNQEDDLKKLNVIKMYLQRLCINTDQMLEVMRVFKSKDTQNDFFLYAKEYITDIEEYNNIKPE